jgi:hypothetical protein
MSRWLSIILQGNFECQPFFSCCFDARRLIMIFAASKNYMAIRLDALGSQQRSLRLLP